MTIRFQCSNCQTSLKVKDELAGRRVRCKVCNSVITIPQPADEDEEFADLITEAVSESSAGDSYPALPSRSPRRKKTRKRRQTDRSDNADLSQAALWSLILGIVALLCCGFLTGVPALIAGIIALVNIGNSGGRLRGKGFAITGMTLGVVGPTAVAVLLFQMGGIKGIEGLVASVSRNTARNRNNLKMIGLALHNYHDSMNVFPPGGIVDRSGVGQHGWQTFLLPFMDRNSLYNRIDFNVPWNDPKNSALFQTEIPEFLLSDFEERKMPRATPSAITPGTATCSEKIPAYGYRAYRMGRRTRFSSERRRGITSRGDIPKTGAIPPSALAKGPIRSEIRTTHSS